MESDEPIMSEKLVILFYYFNSTFEYLLEKGEVHVVKQSSSQAVKRWHSGHCQDIQNGAPQLRAPASHLDSFPSPPPSLPGRTLPPSSFNSILENSILIVQPVMAKAAKATQALSLDDMLKESKAGAKQHYCFQRVLTASRRSREAESRGSGTGDLWQAVTDARHRR